MFDTTPIPLHTAFKEAIDKQEKVANAKGTPLTIKDLKIRSTHLKGSFFPVSFPHPLDEKAIQKTRHLIVQFKSGGKKSFELPKDLVDAFEAMKPNPSKLYRFAYDEGKIVITETC